MSDTSSGLLMLTALSSSGHTDAVAAGCIRLSPQSPTSCGLDSVSHSSSSWDGERTHGTQRVLGAVLPETGSPLNAVPGVEDTPRNGPVLSRAFSHFHPRPWSASFLVGEFSIS